VLEVPLLSTHLYVYYGDQPFKVAKFPIEWLTINVLGAFLAAVIAARGQSFFRGRRQLWLLLVPVASYFASWIVDMPAFWAVNSHASQVVKYGGVGLALILGVLAIDALIQAGRCEPSAVPTADEAPPLTTGATHELQTV
jgi:fluoride ion exporter CrcB/FEX